MKTGFSKERINTRDLSIDLGNNNTLISSGNKILVDQPSFIAINHGNGVKATGRDAYQMVGKTNGDSKTVKPLQSGVIADYDSASKMVKAFVKQAFKNHLPFFGFNVILSGIPYATTEVEKRALRDTLHQFRSNRVVLIHEPVAAAIGADLNIREPDGKLIVDIGGGITEIAVISLSGIVTSQSIKVAGDTFDEDIVEHFRKNYNMTISLNMAEQIKINVGSALTELDKAPSPMMVIGKDLICGIPRAIEIEYPEVAEVLNRSITRLEHALIKTMEDCPPELASDVYDEGIYLTGGGAMLRGLRERIEKRVKLNVHLDPYALHAVSRGISKVLQHPAHFQSLLI